MGRKEDVSKLIERILDDEKMCSYLDQGKFDYFYFYLTTMNLGPAEFGAITEFLIESGVDNIFEGIAGVPNNFLYHSNIRDITIDPVVNGYYVIGMNAFAYSKIENIEFKKGLKRVGKYAFFACNKLKRLEFPEGLEVIDTCALKNCGNLEELVLPSTLKEIGSENFIGIPFKCKIIFNGSEAQWATLRMNQNDRTQIRKNFTDVEFRG